MVEQPAKVMRIGTMIKQLLEEVRAAPLDDASRHRLREIHQRRSGAGGGARARAASTSWSGLTLPFTEDAVPSDAELRIAQAQLVGWLEGLFHGIQTALFAQQMAAQPAGADAPRLAGGRRLPLGQPDQVPDGGQYL